MRPNIIFYFSDQQRWDTVNEEATPNLMQLAREGIQFENSYTCQPVCGPARACLQTGMYATQCGCYWNGVPLPQTIRPMAEYFNEAGYETAYVGKWHLASDRLPNVGFHCEKQRSRKSARAAIKTGGARRTCWNLRPTVMMDMCLMQRAIRLILRVTVRTASMTSRWSISIKNLGRSVFPLHLPVGAASSERPPLL